MQAIVREQFGPPEVLQLKEVARPVPTNRQVLVNVHAASVNALDWRPFTMPPLLVRVVTGGLRTPKTTSLGVDVAGVVEAVGREVTAQHAEPGARSLGADHVIDYTREDVTKHVSEMIVPAQEATWWAT